MSTKRRPIQRSMRARITPEVLELWQRLRAIHRVKLWREEWEPRGRYRELLDGEKQLAKMLGLFFGDAGQPLTVDGPEPPDYMRSNSYQSERWGVAWAWRCALIEASRELERTKDAAGKDAAAKDATA
jgi:hypothetical protein